MSDHLAVVSEGSTTDLDTPRSVVEGDHGLSKSQIEGLAKLREPFAKEHVGKLPRSTKKENPKGNCRECGGWHGLPAVHLDFVGHAQVTARLHNADPAWNWEPAAFTPEGEPLIGRNGSSLRMWIKLTVCGVTRLGVGTVQSDAFDPEKQLIGDALRNAAMRFGVALDLWSKEELEHSEVPPAPPEPKAAEAPPKPAPKQEQPPEWLEPLRVAYNGLSRERQANFRSWWADAIPGGDKGWPKRAFLSLAPERVPAVMEVIGELAEQDKIAAGGLIQTADSPPLQSQPGGGAGRRTGPSSPDPAADAAAELTRLHAQVTQALRDANVIGPDRSAALSAAVERNVAKVEDLTAEECDKAISYVAG